MPHNAVTYLLEGLAGDGDRSRLSRTPRCVGQFCLQAKLRWVFAICFKAEIESFWGSNDSRGTSTELGGLPQSCRSGGAACLFPRGRRR